MLLLGRGFPAANTNLFGSKGLQEVETSGLEPDSVTTSTETTSVESPKNRRRDKGAKAMSFKRGDTVTGDTTPFFSGGKGSCVTKGSGFLRPVRDGDPSATWPSCREDRPVECVNLKARFGQRFKVENEESLFHGKLVTLQPVEVLFSSSGITYGACRFCERHTLSRLLL